MRILPLNESCFFWALRYFLSVKISSLGLLVLFAVFSISCEEGGLESDTGDGLLSASSESPPDGSSTEFLSSLECTDAQYPRWNQEENTWVCSSMGSILEALPNCVQNSVPVVVDGQWQCMTRTDSQDSASSIHSGISSCKAGQTMKWKNGAWSCADDQLSTNTLVIGSDQLQKLTCDEGEIVLWKNGSWTCGEDQNPEKTENTDQFGSLSCPADKNSVVWNHEASSWVCGVDEDKNMADGLSCQKGEALVYSLGQWSCRYPKFRNDLVLSGIAGGDTTCAILGDQSLRCWGKGDSGQLGQGSQDNLGDHAHEVGANLSAINFGSTSIVRQVSVGGEHVCARHHTGKIFCWGKNNRGQLGLADTNNRGDAADEMGTASDLGTDVKAKDIASGDQHTCAVTTDGHVKCWGDNTYGQLGLGKTSTETPAIGDGPNEMGSQLANTTLSANPGDPAAKRLAAGEYHTCAITINDQVKCWGRNNKGQLGLGDTEIRGDGTGKMGSDLGTVSLGTGRTVTMLASGDHHVCALLDHKRVKCWGDNTFGQLGLGLGSTDTPALGDEPQEMGDDLPALDLGGDVLAVAAGGNHTCALLAESHEVTCWGDNQHGQLGLGDITGDKAKIGDSAGEIGTTVSLGDGSRVQSITSGAAHSCALLHDNTLKCWGSNQAGQLGIGAFDNQGDAAGEMGNDLIDVPLFHSAVVWWSEL